MEASRTVLDVIQYANRKGLPLVVISTDFRKAFDCIDLNHIEACLDIYQFPEQFKKAYMKLSRKGTLSIEVNSSLSQDYELEAGVGQGDPRSSYSYNLSASPLNHYLATSDQVPRFKIEDDESSPVFFADDDLLLLDGHTRETDNIIQVLQKITDYKEVSGLDLGLAK